MAIDASHPGLAARLAPWLRAWRAGLIPIDDVVAAMTRGNMAAVDQVVMANGQNGHGRNLSDGLTEFSSVNADDVRLVLAVPGDARGLPISGPFTSEALSAGEAVIVGTVGVVPQAQQHVSGSGDTWQTVTWRTFPLVELPTDVDIVSVPEADAALSEAVREATTTLTTLDVARWNSELDSVMSRVHDPHDQQLPRGFDARSRRLYSRATLLNNALAVAETDALGGAVTAHGATERLATLRPLRMVCRQAIVAVCHARLDY